MKRSPLFLLEILLLAGSVACGGNDSVENISDNISKVTSQGSVKAVNDWTTGLFRFASRTDRLTLTDTGSALAGKPYHGGTSQQWRFKEIGSGAYEIILESNKQCLLESNGVAALGACAGVPWKIETLRQHSVERPGLYRVQAPSGSCLVANGSAAPSLGNCDQSRWYLEPVGYGERRFTEEAELRTLLLVKPVSNVSSPSMHDSIRDDVSAAAQTCFKEHIATWFDRMTDGRIRWTGASAVSSEPLTSVSLASETDWWVAPPDAKKDINRFVPQGAFDGVLVFWTSGASKGGWGFGTGPSADSNWAAWGTVNASGDNDPGRWTSWNHEPSEVFIHEFFHGLTSFYEGSVPLPQDDLHGATTALYDNVSDGWKPWYRDYLLGTVIAPNDTYVGLGSRAFSKGTPRTAKRPTYHVTYQTYDDVKKAWLPNVTDTQDYAGIYGHDVDAIYANLSTGNITYRVHYKGGNWLPAVTNRNDYAGIYNRPIDGLMMKTDTGKTLHYRVHLRRTGQWLPYVTGYNTGDANNGFAGILGQEIDAVQIYLD